MRKSYPIALVLMLLALVPAWLAGSAAKEAYAYQSRAIETTGTITRYQGYPGIGSNLTGKSFMPMVLVELENGAWAEVAANVIMTDDVEKIGAKVEVLYDPAEMNHVRYAGFFNLYGAATYFAVPAVLLLLFGLYLLPMRKSASGVSSTERGRDQGSLVD